MHYTQTIMMRYAALFALAIAATLDAQGPSPWKFAVSGDSRNCGDIVMPAIAAGVLEKRAEFYWHLGDFRAIYTFDEDLVPPASLKLPTKPLTVIDYETGAWPDFIAHQLAPFGNLPVYLSPGNHENIPPATRDQYLKQFVDWLHTPAILNQRLKDDPTDHALRSYYHWIDREIDFIALDNASPDQFDANQLKWLQAVVQRDEASDQIKTIVVGMHAALPGSFGKSHSMEDWPQGAYSGTLVYQELVHAKEVAHKNVYILASHSHFYMEDVYNTETWKGHVLPGWIIGTAGAIRYPLPPGKTQGPGSMTKVYGYMTGTVAADGTIEFAFHKLAVADLLTANQGRLPDSLVHWCDQSNVQQPPPAQH